MNTRRSVRGLLAVVGVVTLHMTLAGQVPGIRIPRFAGEGVTPVYEGWFRIGDALYLSYGYLNLNQRDAVSIPIGPDNRVEPGGPDQGQPTSFVLNRQTGVFVVRVPKDLEQKLKAEKSSITWTLTTNGKTYAIPANLEPQYNVNALKDEESGNTPPALGFEAGGPTVQGPHGIRTEKSAVVGRPLKVDVYVTDDGIVKTQEKPREGMVALTWNKSRGPGDVVFSEKQPKAVGIGPKKVGTASTTATFSAPGRYTLWLDAIDQSRRDFQCCWTNAFVDVTVSASSEE